MTGIITVPDQELVSLYRSIKTMEKRIRALLRSIARAEKATRLLTKKKHKTTSKTIKKMQAATSIKEKIKVKLYSYYCNFKLKLKSAFIADPKYLKDELIDAKRSYSDLINTYNIKAQACGKKILSNPFE